MSTILWLVPLIPLIGALINGTIGSKLGERLSSTVAILSVIGAFIASIAIVSAVGSSAGHFVDSGAMTWMTVPGTSLAIQFNLHVDPLNGGMLLVITGVGALIHIYSASYMHGDKGFSRYFAYLNLFVFFMAVLVMAGNLPLLFVGWEGVGLASYLLIGFWQEKWSATQAAKKAFIVNRIGDVALLLAMFILFREFKTLDLYGQYGILEQLSASGSMHVQTGVATTIALLLFGGAAGKSAQLPLFVWLPDAMEGPTPVSALIHAATMVTAGVYLVCRFNLLFEMSPVAMQVVAWTGGLTALVAACTGVAQWDIKKVLAYSTVSQLGLMFVACGCGAFSAAMFHVTTHAFFKALLFLGAGAVIHALHGEQDMRKMGGLASKIKSTHLLVLIGTIAIAGIPPLAGFWSKDEILLAAFDHNRPVYGLAAVTSALTAFYMWRMYMLTFQGSSRMDEHTAHHLHHPDTRIVLPLGILGVLSVVAGFMNAPAIGMHFYSDWLAPVITSPEHSHNSGLVMGISVGVALVASALSIAKYKSVSAASMEKTGSLFAFFASAMRIDDLYALTIVRPLTAIAAWSSLSVERNGARGFLRLGQSSVEVVGKTVRRWQSGIVGDYILSMAVALIVIISVVLITGTRGGN
jgi:NADH-quinone oxidoreductase subunit L